VVRTPGWWPIRGRIGGGGAPFNVGEATVTRATVRLATGEVGHAYAARPRRSERARLCSDRRRTPGSAPGKARRGGGAGSDVPLRALQTAQENSAETETAATKVDFFTVVSEERIDAAISHIEGGFARTRCFDAQTAFRALMDAMARPGTASTLRWHGARRPRPLMATAAASVALSHCATTTRRFGSTRKLSQGSAAVTAWLGFHTGAPLASTPAEAHFALVADPATLIALENFAQGSVRTTPIARQPSILQVDSFDGGAPLTAGRPRHRDDRIPARHRSAAGGRWRGDRPAALDPHFGRTLTCT
jgi:alpha-D-ribose 1-methylphosphonate 5-triphosphate synthase subunit PhnH